MQQQKILSAAAGCGIYVAFTPPHEVVVMSNARPHASGALTAAYAAAYRVLCPFALFAGELHYEAVFAVGIVLFAGVHADETAL